MFIDLVVFKPQRFGLNAMISIDQSNSLITIITE